MVGYLCDVANNGQEAVDKNELGNYDLIFMDVVCSSHTVSLVFSRSVLRSR